MARVIIECKDCGARYDVTRRKPRSKVRCKSCNAILKIPGKDKSVKNRKRAVPEGESDRSMRVKRAIERESDSEALEELDEKAELSTGEEIQGLSKPRRIEELSAIKSVKRFYTLLMQTKYRFVFVAVLGLSIGVLASLLLALVLAAFGTGSGNQQLFAGLTSIMTGIVTLSAEGAGLIFGRKILTESDEGWEPVQGYKAAFSDALASLRAAVSQIIPLILADLPFYFGILAIGVFIAIAFAIPGIGPLLGSLVVLLFIPGFILLGVYSRLVKIGLLVEQRSFMFSLKRAWLIMNDQEALLYIIKVSLLQAPLIALVVTVFQFASYLVVYLFITTAPIGVNYIAGSISMLFALALNGLFYATVHFDLTKDEGLS